MGKEEDQSTGGYYIGRARWSWRATEVGTAVKQSYHKDTTIECKSGKCRRNTTPKCQNAYTYTYK